MTGDIHIRIDRNTFDRLLTMLHRGKSNDTGDRALLDRMKYVGDRPFDERIITVKTG